MNHIFNFSKLSRIEMKKVLGGTAPVDPCASECLFPYSCPVGNVCKSVDTDPKLCPAGTTRHVCAPADPS
jgi:hypothetical protein